MEYSRTDSPNRDEDKPDNPLKTVMQAWNEQYVLINTLCEDQAAEEITPTRDADLKDYQEGKFGSMLNNQKQLDKVEIMRASGDLDIALEYLATAHDTTPKAPVGLGTIVKVAQLLCIMNECVYMRDYEGEAKIRQTMKPYVKTFENAKRRSLPLDRATVNNLRDAARLDRVTQKIQEVANKMGLLYQPLCNLSSYGSYSRNGPYCGAFYREFEDGSNGFIVIVFKGTGTGKEMVTDLKFNLKSAEKDSPLKGKCHTGFFDGMFSTFLSELSVNKTIATLIPFQTLRNQLWRLAQYVQNDNAAGRKVPVWVTGHSLGAAYATHCWKALLATTPANAPTKNRMVRDLFTFGSPRVGNREYASYPSVDTDFQRSWRFVNGWDSIARIPITSLNLARFYHVDALVNISYDRIRMGRSELYSEPESTEGSIFGDHKLESYWKSLRNGRVVSS